MEVKQAVEVAKNYVLELFQDEGITNLGLEEIEEKGAFWHITIGFTRPWDNTVGSVLSGAKSRTYKVLLVRDEDGRIMSVKDRDISKVM